MGRDAAIRGRRRGDARHLRKLFDGRPAVEVHQAAALAGKKCACGLAAAYRVVSFAPVDELIRRAPQLVVDLARQHGGRVPVVDFKHGKHVRVGEVFGCSICRAAVERAAARGPSWVVVEFQDGPGPERTTVQTARSDGEA